MGHPQESAIAALVFERADGRYTREAAAKVTQEFVSIDFDASYQAVFSPKEIASHVYGYSCAIARNAGSALRASIQHYAHEEASSAFYFCGITLAEQQETLRAIERWLEREAPKAPGGSGSRAISVRSYSAQKSAVRLVLYTVTFEPFLQGPFTPDATIVERLGNKTFLVQRAPETLIRYAEILTRLANSFKAEFTVNKLDPATHGVGAHALKAAFFPDRLSYLSVLTSLLASVPKATVYKYFLETFSNGAHVYTFYIRGADGEALRRAGGCIGQLSHRPNRLSSRLFNTEAINAEELIYINSAIMFAYYFTPPPQSEDFNELHREVRHRDVAVERLKSLRGALFRDIMKESFVAEVLTRDVVLVRQLYQDFVAGSTPASLATLEKALERSMVHADPMERAVLRSAVTFNKAILKTNFFKVEKAAVAYRLDPSFVTAMDLPRVPHGIFLIIGANFRGFHVRFTDIARGGIRMIVSTPTTYVRNKRTVFLENYNLAYAQLLKNKDIPEGGSKGTILVWGRFHEVKNRTGKEVLRTLFLQYVDALLDLIIPGVGGVRTSPAYANVGEEVLFLGPDENTAGDMPTIAAMHAKARGYKHWKSFTTGKDPALGGIPHDSWGMTSVGVRANVERIYKRLGLDETKLTKFQTGGPDGDLGSNEILLSREHYVALCDGAGSIYDPEGVNREELTRLAKARQTLKHFSKTKLSPKGFFVAVEDKNVTLPDGGVVEDGTAFRNNFHFSKYATADLFVPCGGRPASVNLESVHRLVLGSGPATSGQEMLEGRVGNLASENSGEGRLRFKYIVEGANLFFTPDARLALEAVGVVVIKDSMANKGGVTCSSLEVLAGLGMTDAEHGRLMCVPAAAAGGDAAALPKFYRAYVAGIMERIKQNAEREFDVVWDAAAKGHCGGKRTLVTDAVSQRIVRFRQFLSSSSTLFENKALVTYVMRQYLPETLLSEISLTALWTRIPEGYRRAIFSIWIASDYTYTVGLDATEFSFFEYMHGLIAKAEAAARASRGEAKL